MTSSTFPSLPDIGNCGYHNLRSGRVSWLIGP